MKYLLSIIRFALFACSFLLILPRSFVNEAGVGLDGSWNLALHMAFQKGFVFGRDFIFTYGPLGIVQTRLNVGDIKDILIASDLFIYCNILGLGVWALRKIKSITAWLFILATAYVSSVAMYFMEPAIVLFILSIFYTFLYVGYGGFLITLLASLCGVFVLYVKLNLGLCAFLILLAGIFWRLVLGEAVAKSLISFAASIGILTLSTFFVAVDLSLYIKASIEIASGYNEAMVLSVPEFRWLLEPALIICGLFLLFGFVNIRSLFQRNPFPFVYGGVLFSIFLLFKQSFVRADEHAYTLIEYAPVFALILFVLFQRAWTSWALVVGVLSVSSFVVWDRLWIDQPLRKIDEVNNYLSSVRESKFPDNFSGEVPLAAQLPSEFISAIGTSTVDSIPWDIAALYYNNLNYLPRRVIQSYSAYTPYLDEVSAQKLISDNGPQFLIFSLDCIDGRYCWFDETLTKLSILRSYEVKESRAGKLLLGKRANLKTGTIHHLESGIGAINQPIVLPHSDENLVIWTPEIRHSSFGTIEKIFFRAPPLKIHLTLEDGSKRDFSGILPILRGGVFVDRFIGNTEDARMYFNGGREKLLKIRSITLNSSSSGSFNPQFSYKFSKVVLKDG